MKRYQWYRGWCSRCKTACQWQESSVRRVDKLLCPNCGALVLAIMGGVNAQLAGMKVCEARTFIDTKRKG